MEKFYLTTAIAYASRKPHFGNTYEIIMSDAFARFQRSMGKDVFLCTGTDEHGQKIENLANEAGISPKEYVDGVAGEIKRIWDLMDVKYDHFIRTTDDYHVSVVQKIFKKFYEQGDIYKGFYEGWYCTPCESFFTATQAADGKCPDCGREVSQAREEAYFFKMSKYADRLIKHIEDNPGFIEPESRKKEMLNNFLLAGLQDLCVSRTSFKWGIPVDFDDRHVVYVWLDALTNYITAIGYDPDKSYEEQCEKFKKYWPCDVHIIGKDILRFHTIYWPIFLMALGLPLPKKVFGHPWFNFGADKMSKSRGNVVFADELAEIFGVDGVRYYAAVKTGISESTRLMSEYHVADSLEEIFAMLRRANKYIDETMPWALAKNEADRPRLATVIYNLLEVIRVGAVLLTPYIPSTAANIFAQLGTDKTDRESITAFGALETGKPLGEAHTLFQRIDEKKFLADMESKVAAAAAAVKAEEIVEPEHEREVGIDAFAALELRVGEILECEPVPRAKKLLKLQIDLGYEKRQVVSGIAKYYTPDELIGKKVIVIVNLKPATLCGVESRGMLLASGEDDVKVVFIDKSVKCGERVR